MHLRVSLMPVLWMHFVDIFIFTGYSGMSSDDYASRQEDTGSSKLGFPKMLESSFGLNILAFRVCVMYPSIS